MAEGEGPPPRVGAGSPSLPFFFLLFIFLFFPTLTAHLEKARESQPLPYLSSRWPLQTAAGHQSLPCEPKTSGITGSRVYPSGVREHTLGSYHASRSPRQRHSRFFLHLEPAPVPFDTERLYSRTPFVSSPTWVCSHSKASCPSMRPILAHRKERGRSPFDQRVCLWRERNACQRLQASVQVQPSCLDMSPTTFGD